MDGRVWWLHNTLLGIVQYGVWCSMMYNALPRCKTYECANNVCVKKILSQVISLKNFTLFCRESKYCRDFALFVCIFWHVLELYATCWPFFLHYLDLLGLSLCLDFFVIYALFRVTLFGLKPCSCTQVVFLHLWCSISF